MDNRALVDRNSCCRSGFYYNKIAALRFNGNFHSFFKFGFSSFTVYKIDTENNSPLTDKAFSRWRPYKILELKNEYMVYTTTAKEILEFIVFFVAVLISDTTVKP